MSKTNFSMNELSYSGATREYIITKMRDLLTENRGCRVHYSIPENCPGDGEDGSFTEDKIYRMEHGSWEGEAFSYDEVETDILQEILDSADEQFINN